MFRLLACLLLLTPTIAAAESRETALTIYSQLGKNAPSASSYLPDSHGNIQWQGRSVPGYGFVRERFSLDLDRKQNTVTLPNIAPLMDPTTVILTSLTAPRTTSMVEQNYHFDLVSQSALLEQFIGKTIAAEQLSDDGINRIEGTLLSRTGGLTLLGDDGTISLLKDYDNLVLPAPEKELHTKPTLVWDVVTTKPGTHRMEVSYQTAGVTWWTDYEAIYQDGRNANSGFIDLSAKVGVVNRSGINFDDTQLKFVAGQINRANNNQQPMYMAKTRGMESMMAADAAPAQVSEKSFFEFHLYTLPRAVDLPNNSMKRFELFPTSYKIPTTRTLLFRGNNNRYHGYNSLGRQTGSNKDVGVYLSFDNDEASNLGVPLPAGRMRVSHRDASDGALEFIGEDSIHHTADGEEVRLFIGNAFDVSADRKQVDFTVDNKRKILTETFKITLKNHKDDAVTVEVEEPLYRAKNWRILSSAPGHKKLDANLIGYTVSIPPKDERTVKYTVEYTW